jgi:hypothetical protein
LTSMRAEVWAEVAAGHAISFSHDGCLTICAPVCNPSLPLCCQAIAAESDSPALPHARQRGDFGTSEMESTPSVPRGSYTR